MSEATLTLRGAYNLAKFFFRHQENLLPVLRSYKYFGSRIRISAAAILCIERDGKYVLVRNHHRPEQYAPFGGVYKHDLQKPAILDTIEWVSDYTTRDGFADDMKCDLRGIIHGRHFPVFIDWFSRCEGREGESCVLRELREELMEGRVGKILRDKGAEIKLTRLRRVLEGPNVVEDQPYQAQFRYFEILRPQETGDGPTRALVDELFRRAEKRDNGMIVASKDEILELRTKDRSCLIGPHAKYYFSSRWHRQESAKY